MIPDRRQKGERRSGLRYLAQIEIEWENVAGRQRGTISDLSETGCFVLCSGAVTDGERVKLCFSVENEKDISLSGEVVNHLDEIGFAARFVELNDVEKLFLDRLTQTSRPFKERR